MRQEARAAGGDVFRPPEIHEIVEVEVHDGHVETAGEPEWRRAHVRRSMPDGRFLATRPTSRTRSSWNGAPPKLPEPGLSFSELP